MPRSLRAWLASLALIAFPGLAPAQTFLGPPHLAPVALEARCPLVDGLSGAVTHLMALGADPLHVALLKADAERGGIAAADRSPCTDDSTCNDEVVAQDVVAGERPVEATPANADVRASLARLAAEEPVDVATESGSKPGSEKGRRLVGSSAVVVLLEEEYLPYDLQADEPLRLRLLPFSVPRRCQLNRSARALEADATPASEVADCAELAECYAFANRGTGAKRDEMAADDKAVERDAVAGQELIAHIVELVPTSRDVAAIRRWVASLQPPMPLHCWLHEAVSQVSDALDVHGPIRRELRAERMGTRLGQLSLRAERSIADAVQPVMPILARVPAAQEPPARAPENLPAPAAIEDVEWSFAAGALDSAAGQLESLAAALRSWSASVDRVARAKAAGPEALRR